MREIVLDTETTGLDVNNGDRIVEIGIVELENHVQTGTCFHYYLNPERDSGLKALQIHGLTKEFLKLVNLNLFLDLNNSENSYLFVHDFLTLLYQFQLFCPHC